MIISFCVLLLVAYLFELTASRTRIPAVIILLAMGFLVKQVTVFFAIQLPDFSFALPILGTVGLILIVLEGSLELELNRSRIGLVSRSSLGSLFSIVVLALGFGFSFRYLTGCSLQDGMLNAVPLCVISSSVAIPSIRHLVSRDRDFVIYESSLSDIFGVLLFNFLAVESTLNASMVGRFGLQLLSITLISFLATIGLSLLLSRIEHHIKFFPIILLVVLIYTVSIYYDLPALIFILLFGLFLGNIDKLKGFRWIEKFRPAKLSPEVGRLKELVIESTFLVRALFFLLFGYLIQTEQLFNSGTFIYAAIVTAAILLVRGVQLKLSGLPLSPLLFVAPRGLITVLLFVSIDQSRRIPLVNNSLILQVVILTSLVMMIGLMTARTKKENAQPEDPSTPPAES